MFKAEGTVIESRKNEWMQKQLTGLFFKDKVLNYFVLQSKVKQHATPYERRLIGFLKRMDAKSADAFVEFAKYNPAFAENKIIAFLSSERGRADRGQICRYYKQLGQSSEARYYLNLEKGVYVIFIGKKDVNTYSKIKLNL